ncbi:MAG: TolC family protein [Bacteroidota bacterium]
MNRIFLLLFLLVFSIGPNEAQGPLKTPALDTLAQATLQSCVQYALQHQPIVQQSLIDEQIVDKTIQTKLADWYPQISMNYYIQHNYQLPAFYFGGNYVRNGTYNASNLGLTLTQNIFNRDALLASQTAQQVKNQVRQNTVSNKIDVTVNVSKAFYDVLLTQKQVQVLDQAIIRLQKNVQDSYHQYEAGIVDKTDYKRATISLNNTIAQRKQVFDLVKAKSVYLKELMGYPDSADLHLSYDTTAMEKDAFIDTSVNVFFENRIEYQQLVTQQKLQQANLKYYKWGFIPTISAYGIYNFNYLNNDFGKLYNQNLGNSNIGLQLSVPIFQGNKRVNQIKEAQLQIDRLNWDVVALKSRVNTEYATALANYKGNLANYVALKDNLSLANDVYETIQLQYNSGIKTYLDVIVAESDLRTAQLNYYDALYQLLESKIDVEKALGTIKN